MIEDIFDNLDSILVGIRMRRSFGMESKMSEIVDRILNSEINSLLGEYGSIDEGPRHKKLYNKETGNYFQVSIDDILVNYKLNNEENELEKIHEIINDKILNGIMSEYEIGPIKRVGYINRYQFSGNIVSNFLNNIVGNTFNEINDINLRFSKKLPLMKSHRKDINDFRNIIINVLKEKKEELLKISVDYQYINDPLLEKSSMVEFEDFIQKMKSYNEEEILNWLNDNYMD